MRRNNWTYNTMSTVLKLDDLHFKREENNLILNGLTLRVSADERIGIFGPIACGKSTLLHLCVGLIFPNSGSIEILGKTIKTESDFKTIRTEIQLVFQNADNQLFCPTVIEDVAFGPINKGLSINDATLLAYETLEKLGIAHLKSKLTSKLSGGEKRKVAIATALAMKPKILLLDEPDTALDEESSNQIIEIINSLKQTVIIVSHNKTFLKATTSSIYKMEGGALV